MRLASAVDRRVKYQYLYSSGAVVRADSMSAVVMGSVAVNPGADGRPSATHTHSYYNSQAVCKQTTKIAQKSFVAKKAPWNLAMRFFISWSLQRFRRG